MQPENSFVPEALIGKYLAGEATPEEAMRLDEWLSEGSNKQLFERIQTIWLQAAAGDEMKIPPAKSVWDELKPKQNQRHRVPRWMPYGIAACLAGGLAFLLYSGPGTYKPSLKTDDHSLNYRTSAAGNVVIDSLQDGSVVTVNRRSALSYPGSRNERKVQMKGEAFFSVAPDKSRPFTINVDRLQIIVVGTEFNVKEIGGANSVEVQVRSGIVKMVAGGKEILVKKGQTGWFTVRDGALALREGVDVNSMAYATGSFSFNDLSLERVCDYLQKAFDVQIDPGISKFRQCRITADFDRKPLPYILDVIGATLDLTYSLKDNRISFNGNACQ